MTMNALGTTKALRNVIFTWMLFMTIALVGAPACRNAQNNLAMTPKPDVAPRTEPPTVTPLKLDASHVKPMFTELSAIDLSAVVGIALAENFEIRQARLSVEAQQGRYESVVGGAFPAIVPTALFEQVNGTVRSTEGNLVGVGFRTFQPSIALQWVVNPGRVLYDILAAKKRLHAAEHREEAVILETLRRAAIQYYSLVLAQASVSAANQGVLEADELLRISTLRLQTGTGVLADRLRAEARLAARQQDLVTGMKTFYDASVALSVTLHLDATVTLVPRIDSLPPIRLVRTDLTIDEMLGYALTFRPDLKSVRELVEVAKAQRGASWWGGFGPTLTLGYQYGGITGHANNVTEKNGLPGNLIVNPASSTGSFSSNPVGSGLIKEGILRGSKLLGRRDDRSFVFSDQHRFTASASWRFSLSIFGDLKTADARERQAVLGAEQLLDGVRADVVSAAQAGKASEQLIVLAQQQVLSAEEALRLTEVNLRAGAMTTLDVLQSQDAATQARLRYAEAVVRYNQSQVNLLSALGLLSSVTLVDKTSPSIDDADTGTDTDTDG